jgi:uncharacterized protein (TIGR04141 family)
LYGTLASVDTVSRSRLPEEPAAEARSEDTHIDQVRVYLLRPEMRSFEAALLHPRAARPIPTDAASGLEGVLYVSRRRSRPPRWVAFAESITGQAIEHPRPVRLSAVLFVQRGNRRFAITFGYGRHMLRREAIEPDYGLKAAAGLVDPGEIASLDARSVEATTIQVRRQTSRGTDPAAIGFDVRREMLRAIAGRVPDESIGTRIVGADAVGLTARLDAATIGARLDTLYRAFEDRAYLANFDHLDRWQTVGPGDTRDRLDNELLRVLGRRRELLRAGEDPSALPGTARPPVLEAPEVIDWHASGFRTTAEAATTLHPFPDLDAFLRVASREPSTSLLRRHRLELVSDEADEVLEAWPVYAALHWEMELQGEYYVLAEGSWWRIDAEYRRRIDGIVGSIPAASLERPAFDPIEHEVDYNKRMADFRPGRALLDRHLARFQYENGTVEPCDVITPERQLVHVKREASSATLGHLFAQAAVSARLFLMLPEFRAQVRRLVQAQPEVAALIPVGRPTTAEYEVVLAIISADSNPDARRLPFFSRNYLAYIQADVAAMGYALSLAWVEERAGARPADAGPLFRELTQERASVRVRSTRRRSRRRSTGRPGLNAASVGTTPPTPPTSE